MQKNNFTVFAMALLLLFTGNSILQAQTTISIDGDMSDWTESMRLDVPPNRPIVTWHDGDDFNRTEPADPDDLDYMVDLNVAGLWATDDEDWLYVRIDMNERADVRRVLTDSVTYPSNQRIELHISTDPQFDADLRDTTGMTWGWYDNGVDFQFNVLAIDEEFYDSTGYHGVIREHIQFELDSLENKVPVTGSSFQQYQRRDDLGVYFKWNEDWNKVEIAIPKSVILQPVNLPEDRHNNPFVSMYVATGSANVRTGDQWWQQRVANNSNVAGYPYAYEADWSGDDPSSPPGDEETSILSGNTQPEGFELLGNYPNPFNPTTNIKFNLERTENVQIEVFDILGRAIATMDYGTFNAGSHSVTFDASRIPSGMYLYTVTAGQHRATGKMMLLK